MNIDISDSLSNLSLTNIGGLFIIHGFFIKKKYKINNSGHKNNIKSISKYVLLKY